jgi:antitoxin ParD1/3/4
VTDAGALLADVAVITKDDKPCYPAYPGCRSRRLSMNVSLTPELEELVQERVRSGRYTSASEVVREALRLLADRDELRQLRLQEVRAKVVEGLDAIEAGDVHSGDEVFDELMGSAGRSTARQR